LSNYVAFFDIDNTVISATSGKVMATQGYRAGLLNNWNLAEGIILSLLYRIKLMKSENVIKLMAKWLKDIPEKEIIDFSVRLFDEHLRDMIREKARDEVDFHNSNGGVAVIISATTPYLCEMIKEELKMGDFICSELEVIDGRYSGLPLGNYCYGEEKLVQASDYCKKHGFNFTEAYYYGDSASDIPLLEAVGHPMCVTPDKKLEKVAIQKGWTICEW
jgi:HAD superfamily hydrolase (TIGR01490 family)